MKTTTIPQRNGDSRPREMAPAVLRPVERPELIERERSEVAAKPCEYWQDSALGLAKALTAAISKNDRLTVQQLANRISVLAQFCGTAQPLPEILDETEPEEPRRGF